MSTSVGAARFTCEFLDGLRCRAILRPTRRSRTFMDNELDANSGDPDRSDEGDDRGCARQFAAARQRRGVAGAPCDSSKARPPLPAWAEPKLIEHGQNLFAEYLPQFGLALWMASIPAGYAGAKDAVVLERTAQLVSARRSGGSSRPASSCST